MAITADLSHLLDSAMSSCSVPHLPRISVIAKTVRTIVDLCLSLHGSCLLERLWSRQAYRPRQASTPSNTPYATDPDRFTRVYTSVSNLSHHASSHTPGHPRPLSLEQSRVFVKLPCCLDRTLPRLSSYLVDHALPFRLQVHAEPCRQTPKPSLCLCETISQHHSMLWYDVAQHALRNKAIILVQYVVSIRIPAKARPSPGLSGIPD
jgi:hypothetical protein